MVQRVAYGLRQWNWQLMAISTADGCEFVVRDCIHTMTEVLRADHGRIKTARP